MPPFCCFQVKAQADKFLEDFYAAKQSARDDAGSSAAPTPRDHSQSSAARRPDSGALPPIEGADTITGGLVADPDESLDGDDIRALDADYGHVADVMGISRLGPGQGTLHSGSFGKPSGMTPTLSLLGQY